MAKLKSGYVPPFTITSEIVRLVSEISETMGGFSVTNPSELPPVLRRGNRLRPILAYLQKKLPASGCQQRACWYDHSRQGKQQAAKIQDYPKRDCLYQGMNSKSVFCPVGQRIDRFLRQTMVRER